MPIVEVGKEDAKFVLTFVVIGIILAFAEFSPVVAVGIVLVCVLAHKRIGRWLADLY